MIANKLGGCQQQDVEQLLAFVLTGKLAGLALEDLVDVRCDHRRRIDDRIAAGDGLVLLPGRNPEGFQAERRLLDGAPGNRRMDEAGIERQHVVGRNLVLAVRSEEHTSELQSLMRSSYAVFCLKKKTTERQHRKDY